MSAFTGPERAAILLMSLGEEGAAAVLSHMEEREIQSLGNHMSELGDVDTTSMDMVSKEFYDTIKTGAGGLGLGGMDFLRTTLMKALDPAKATEILNNITTPGEEMGGGLETVRMLEPKIIASFLTNEHPQTAAIVMAHLEPAVGGQVIQEIPEEKRMEIIHRLATLERVSPQVLRDLDEALQSEFRTSGAVSGSKLGGVQSTVSIMGSLDRASETGILVALDEVDQELADQIRSLRFTFEDIIQIDDTGIQLVLKEINQDDLIIAMKTASDKLKEKLLRNMSERAAAMLEEDLESLGPQKISDVEKAQHKIIDACKKLEESGKITMGGGEELV